MLMHIVHVCALIIHSPRTHPNCLCTSCMHVYIWIMHPSYVFSAVNRSLYPSNQFKKVQISIAWLTSHNELALQLAGTLPNYSVHNLRQVLRERYKISAGKISMDAMSGTIGHRPGLWILVVLYMYFNRTSHSHDIIATLPACSPRQSRKSITGNGVCQSFDHYLFDDIWPR